MINNTGKIVAHLALSSSKFRLRYSQALANCNQGRSHEPRSQVKKTKNHSSSAPSLLPLAQDQNLFLMAQYSPRLSQILWTSYTIDNGHRVKYYIISNII